ncbi:helix-turn-helix domain-containing protein [Undibacterium sp. Ji50W]|uniref:helix-turn-helix domain-containing protein n=1 Tax=Undibacterium sp. Ji50W TaxID=3413041 RepID=UPI003BF410A7
MSIALMTAAFRSPIQSTHKFVLVALCDNANDQGECYPSVSMLCEKTSLSDRSVQKSLAYLEEKQFIQRRERHGRSNYYYIADPRTWFTPEQYSPPNDVHPTPERGSPPPPNVVHPTPERGSPITINEPSLEPSVNQSGRKVRGKTILPKDWILTKKLGDWALEEFPHWKADDVRRIADKFRDHWVANGKQMKDWEATFRNWCRNENRPWTANARASPAKQLSAKDQARQAVSEALTGNGGGQHGRIIDI